MLRNVCNIKFIPCILYILEDIGLTISLKLTYICSVDAKVSPYKYPKYIYVATYTQYLKVYMSSSPDIRSVNGSLV